MAAHSSPIKADLRMIAATPPRPAIDASGADTSGPHVLTVKEVAAELRCSKAHVHNLIAGKVPGVSPLPAMLLGRRRLIRRVSLEEWMEANEHHL